MNAPYAFIVEDHEDLAFVFSESLKSVGYETEMITDGRLASQRLTEAVPDVVVLDLHMPNISGEVLLKQIRADERLKHVRVMIATADAQYGEKLRPLADLVLLKPVSFGQLAELAQRFINHPR